MAKASAEYLPSMSDEAVKIKTGKTWSQWFAALDKAEANKLPHKQIAELLHATLGVPAWWSQMVTVEYERARGLRKRNQRTDGYSLTASKTLPVSLKTLYSNLVTRQKRARWFPAGNFQVTSMTDQEHLRAKGDGGTNLEINAYAKSGNKSQITVQHSKFKDASSMEVMRTEWKAALGRLANHLL